MPPTTDTTCPPSYWRVWPCCWPSYQQQPSNAWVDRVQSCPRAPGGNPCGPLGPVGPQSPLPTPTPKHKLYFPFQDK